MKTSAHAAISKRHALSGAALAILAALLTGCVEPREPGRIWPAGAWIVGRTEALEDILSKLEEFDGTPLARAAVARRRTLPTCATVETVGQPDAFGDALDQLACPKESSALSRLFAEVDGADFLFSLPFAGGKALHGRGTIDSGGEIAIELTLPRSAIDGPGSLLVPGSTPPGSALLSRENELVHARIRPERGIDIASWVADGDQADQLFRLKTRLFAGSVLDGSWEAAIYLPTAGHAMPRAALALGISHRTPAVGAMEEFITELVRAWPVHRTPFAFHEAEGACLLDLNILPEFAPCYVATEQALVAGWNPASLRHALTNRPTRIASAESRLVIDLERFPHADALLAGAADSSAPLDSTPVSAGEHAPPPPTSSPYPWRRVVAERVPGDEGVTIELTFEAGAGA